jgi:beta-lactamase regulating signal transducer with metallopeptidase domain
MILAVFDHLWQSTLFTLVVGLLVLAMRTNRASARFCLWSAASLKFLVPFSLFISVGNQLGWLTGVSASPKWTIFISGIAKPTSLFSSSTTQSNVMSFSYGLYVLIALWFVGFVAVVTRWCVQWRRIKTAARSATSVNLGVPIETRYSATALEPGVIGITNPILLLPKDIETHLTSAQLQAVLNHELCHVRRLDNLTSSLHMVVEAIFWFYPLVWWLGARLIVERERACDEAVIRAGNDPQVYAEAILNVCKHYVASPLVCASGVSGADLTRRIEYIVANRIPAKLNALKKLLVALAGGATIAGPILIGLFETRLASAQSGPALSADKLSVGGDVFTARGEIKVSVPARDEPGPPIVLEASTLTKSDKGIIVMVGFRIRDGSFFLTADSAVMLQGPHGEPIFDRCTLTGSVRLRLPQGDLFADKATLHLNQTRHLFALVTANGSWIEAADQSGEKTRSRSGEALRIQYGPNNTVEISRPVGAE